MNLIEEITLSRLGRDVQEKDPRFSGVFFIKNYELIFSKIRVRSRNCIWSFFSFICSTDINCITVATFFTIFEDQAIAAYTFFLDQVVDNCIYSIPASLLLKLVTCAISCYHYVATRRVTHTISNYSQQSLSIITQFN